MSPAVHEERAEVAVAERRRTAPVARLVAVLAAAELAVASVAEVRGSSK